MNVKALNLPPQSGKTIKIVPPKQSQPRRSPGGEKAGSQPVPSQLEPRLQQRYRQLVAEHLHTSEELAAGIRALPAAGTAFASTQAAWRFFRNPRVGLADLAEPLIACGRQALKEGSDHYALVVYDWSRLSYKHHRNKRDRAVLKNRKDLGYELETALLISDQEGMPLAPLCQSLRSAQGLYTTRSTKGKRSGTRLDRLTGSLQFVESLQLGKPVVHIMDREADSVGHYRQWQQQRMQFVVRADQQRVVKQEGQDRLLPEVVEQLARQGAFRSSGEVDWKGQKAQQFLAETRVVLDRPARPKAKGKQGKRQSVPGEPIELRLVVSQVRSPQGQLWAEWLLLAHLPESVPASQIALWYYWRWKVESYFKLLKSAGHQLEQWLQQSAPAIARRLLVASMACVLVWQLARSPRPEAASLRPLLVRLSGRQMKRKKPFTEPALLAGLWVLLSMLEVLGHYSLEQLKEAAEFVLPGYF
jgi:hypothetical protein